MKGIILSGGEGTRLRPLTKVTSKQLLPIYNKPMIYYPLEKLLSAGVKEILIIVAPDHCGDYMKVLGSGKDFGPGVKFTYEIQDKPDGLAQAFIIGENFLDDGDNVCLILGDNIFEADLTQAIQNFRSGATVFAKQVPDPERFGVVKFNDQQQAELIIEKPKEFVSDYAVTGVYIYDNKVVQAAKSLTPSDRGELEITDLNNWYLQRGELNVEIMTGDWIDAGTFDSYYKANQWAYERSLINEQSKASAKQEQLLQHTNYHAQLMLQLYQTDGAAFAHLTINTPDPDEASALSPHPMAQSLILKIIEVRQIINAN